MLQQAKYIFGFAANIIFQSDKSKQSQSWGQFHKALTVQFVLLCSFTNYGNFQLIPDVVRYPLFEVPYPQLKRGQQSLGALVAVVRPFRYINLVDHSSEHRSIVARNDEKMLKSLYDAISKN